MKKQIESVNPCTGVKETYSVEIICGTMALAIAGLMVWAFTHPNLF